ncbi:MAG: hypothetical protein AMJ65_09700 [Phycisphaerae bacterium SG8_4]|nr:MAG: hypothetical protein AMJ65_09700 [Phycisphaerae bacterium SG8_4]
MSNEVQLDPEVIAAALQFLEDWHVEPHSVEVPFINWGYGFGGRIDLIGTWFAGGPPDLVGRTILLDWKFRETKPDQKITYWPDYVINLAGYGVGYFDRLPYKLLEECDLVSVVVSVNEPGRYEFKVWELSEVEQAWLEFYADLQAWFVAKKYDPREGPHGNDENDEDE